MLRGIEIYKGCPIFYSLGSLLMEFEAGEQRMTPEMYEGFGLKRDALPSHMHMSRVRDATGKRIGFYGDARFSKSCIAVCDFDPMACKSNSCRSISTSIALGPPSVVCRPSRLRILAVK